MISMEFSNFMRQHGSPIREALVSYGSIDEVKSLGVLRELSASGWMFRASDWIGLKPVPVAQIDYSFRRKSGSRTVIHAYPEGRRSSFIAIDLESNTAQCIGEEFSLT